jgi:hypothetical protein
MTGAALPLLGCDVRVGSHLTTPHKLQDEARSTIVTAPQFRR